MVVPSLLAEFLADRRDYSDRRDLTRDFPDAIRPTTAVGPPDESIADREISKRTLYWVEGVAEQDECTLSSHTRRSVIHDARRCLPTCPSAPASTSGTCAAVLHAARNLRQNASVILRLCGVG